MSCEPAVKEGTIPFVVEGETFHTWYKVVGDLSIITRPPLIVLHGGPGTSHDYMIPLADLASRPSPTAVIFYDQIGTARSTHLPHKPTAFWCIDLFVHELDNVLKYFGLTSKSYDILGHSWGGQLASEFFLRKRPATLRRLILANTLAETVLRDEARWRLMRAIPAEAQETIRRHEVAGDTLAPEYKLAWRKFYERYACILRPLPAELIYSIEQSEMDDAGGCVLNNMCVLIHLYFLSLSILTIVTLGVIIFSSTTGISRRSFTSYVCRYFSSTGRKTT